MIPSGYDHAGESGPHSEITKVVAHHGPATGHTHFSGGGMHTVITQHGDGHVHTSSGHPDFGHAMEHIGIAHGATE